jgi:hypothetical protein
MKLKFITETEMSGSKNVIRDAATAFGSLIEYIYTLDDQGMERRTLDAFLDEPTPENWGKSNWLIDTAIDDSGSQEDVLRGWAGLKTLKPEVAVAALYDVDSRFTQGTPFQDVSLGSKKQKDVKAAMGPQGFVSTTSELGELSPSDAHDVLDQTAEKKDAIDDAVEQDLPSNVKKIEKF